jgi:hypothetical protein
MIGIGFGGIVVVGEDDAHAALCAVDRGAGSKASAAAGNDDDFHVSLLHVLC